MLTRPKINEMWYEKLSQSPKDENLLQNLNQASDEVSDVKCLTLNKVSKSDPKFSLRVLDCNEKHAAICRVKPQMINDLTKPPKFPCLALNQDGRRKRSTHNSSRQKRENDKGLLF